MKTTTKKPAVIKTKAEVIEKTAKKVVPVAKKKTKNITIELGKIAEAYKQAISGKIKFSDVKEMFKELHREVKKTSK